MADYCGVVTLGDHDSEGDVDSTLITRFSTVDGLPAPYSRLRVVVISDTHESHEKLVLPPGDVLLHCGDCFNGIAPFRREEAALKGFFSWLNAQPFHVKIFIGGNHDSILSKRDKETIRRMAAPALYLCDESAVIEPLGLRVFGSPRSIANSWVSPNTAYQRSDVEWNTSPVQSSSLTHPSNFPPADGSSDVPLTVRLETVCAGPVDILMTHQGLEARSKKHNAALLTFIDAVAPRWLHCGGHAHGGRGVYRLRVKNGTHHLAGTLQAAGGGAEKVHIPPHEGEGECSFLLSVNAAIKLKHFFFGSLLQPPMVLDLDV